MTELTHSLSNAVAETTRSIQWSLLKSLTLTGKVINVRIQHQPTIAASRLLSVEIRGANPKALQLSHASIFCLQQLAQANWQVGLKIENIQMQD
ncbi:MAG: hypothetical protein BYD32DRAFT_463747 [Podila humilis]|nr:MAG: hypothetical protein BYD32DRAFT_463747 [Podila humilis]